MSERLQSKWGQTIFPQPQIKTAYAMVGFRLAKGRRPVVLARINACRKHKDGGFEEALEVWLSRDGQKQRWLKSGAFERALRPLAVRAMKEEGMFPKSPEGYSIQPQCTGLAEIGEWHEQNAWSDDSYLALRADSPQVAKYVMKAISKVLPVTGGGVAGTAGYRGSGWSGSGTEWKYHYSSFGIGD